MADLDMSRRALLRNAAFIGAGVLALQACTFGGSSTGNGDAAKSSKLPDIEGGEVITDPARFPATLHESPEFAGRVAAGELPPVTERIGQDPLVIKPAHEIGKYGGTIRRGFAGASDVQNANRFCAGPDNLLYWDYRHKNVIPNIARGFEMNSDHTELTLHLRRGMRWSDGHPFTADDILFWRNDISLEPSLGLGPGSLQVSGRDVVVEKLDDYTVLYRCPSPYAILPEFLAGYTDIGGQSYAGALGGGGFAPKHYLANFLPKYTSEATVSAQARAAGFPSWQKYLLNRNTWQLNAELPTLTPWIVKRTINDPPLEFTANPYSVWVDTEGNQLPYIPTISMSQSESAEVISLRAVSGHYDFQDRGLTVSKYPLLIQNQERGGYTLHRAPGDGIECAVRINLAYDKDPEIGNLIRSVDFRRALSLGVDRDQINETFFLGTSRPSAALPAESSPYYPGDAWRTKWATHDIQQANQLLDKIGLAKKDADGFRLLPSGRDRIRLDIQSAAQFADFPAIGEMVKTQWKEIGIDATNETVEGALLIQRTLSGDLMMTVNVTLTDDVFGAPETLLPKVTNNYSGLIGIPYAKWLTSGGRTGQEPPESVSNLKEAWRLYQQALAVPTAERAELGKKIFMLHIDEVWSISIVGFGLTLYGLYLAKNELGNVPARIMNNTPQKTPSNVLPMTLYYR